MAFGAYFDEDTSGSPTVYCEATGLSIDTSTNALSFCFWFKNVSKSYANDGWSPVALYNGSSCQISFVTNLGNATWHDATPYYFRKDDGGAQDTRIAQYASPNPPDGPCNGEEWFFAATWNVAAGQWTIYTARDGTPLNDGVTGSSGQTAHTYTQIRIGNQFLTGKSTSCHVGKVRLWSGTEMSKAQLQAEMLSPTPVVTANLYASYPLDTASDLTDHSTNSFDLTAYGSPTNGTLDPIDVRNETRSCMRLNAESNTGTRIHLSYLAANQIDWTTEDFTACIYGRYVAHLVDTHGRGHTFLAIGKDAWVPATASISINQPGIDWSPHKFLGGSMGAPWTPVTEYSNLSGDVMLKGTVYFFAITYNHGTDGSDGTYTFYWGADGVALSSLTRSVNQVGASQGQGVYLGTIFTQTADTNGSHIDVKNMIAWKRCHSSGELQAQRKSIAPVITSGLYGHWKLDNATDLTDYSGNGRTLTLVNNNGTVRTRAMDIADLEGTPITIRLRGL